MLWRRSNPRNHDLPRPMAKILSANIHCRKAGWTINVIYSDGKRRQLSAKSKRDAQEKVNQLKAEEEGQSIKQENELVKQFKVYTVRNAFDDAVKYQWADTAGERQAILYGMQVVNFFEPNTPMADIDAGAVLDFKLHLKEERNNKPQTINAKYSKIRVMQQMAIQFGRVRNLPVLPKNLKLNNHRDRYWLDSEIKEVCTYLEKIGRNDVIRYFIFLCEMGCRPIEMERNITSDFDPRKKTITFFKEENDNKNGNRTLPLTPLALQMMQEQVSPVSSAKIWPQTPGSMYFQLNKARQHCNIKKIRVIKDTRHTCGTRLGKAGLSSLQIAAWLGHSSPAMCERYVHMPHDQHAECYEALTKLRVAA